MSYNHASRKTRGHVRFEVTLSDRQAIDDLQVLQSKYSTNVELISKALRALVEKEHEPVDRPV